MPQLGSKVDLIASLTVGFMVTITIVRLVNVEQVKCKIPWGTTFEGKVFPLGLPETGDISGPNLMNPTGKSEARYGQDMKTM